MPEYVDDVEWVNSLVDTVLIMISTMPRNIVQYKKGSYHQKCKDLYIYLYRVIQEECARPREGVPYVKVY